MAVRDRVASVTTPWNGPPARIVRNGPGALLFRGSGSRAKSTRYRCMRLDSATRRPRDARKAPGEAFDASETAAPRVDAKSLVTVRQNRYSVPVALAPVGVPRRNADNAEGRRHCALAFSCRCIHARAARWVGWFACGGGAMLDRAIAVVWRCRGAYDGVRSTRSRRRSRVEVTDQTMRWFPQRAT